MVGTAYEESNETAILPSHDDKDICGGLSGTSSQECSIVVNFLSPAKEKEEIFLEDEVQL